MKDGTDDAGHEAIDNEVGNRPSKVLPETLNEVVDGAHEDDGKIAATNPVR